VKTSDFNFELPPELIAQEPLPDRAQSRLMVVDRKSGRIEHRRVVDLPTFLRAGDRLVLNNTRVIPARLFGHKVATGGRVELLLLEEVAPNTWDVLCGVARKPRPGAELLMAGGRLRARVVANDDSRFMRVEFNSREPLLNILEEEGIVPLPPYIHREIEDTHTPDTAQRQRHQADRERYQTVFARVPGAVAAPTAGLHLTEGLLAGLKGAGVGVSEITLHVGVGTFKPIKVEELTEHRMDPERYIVSAETAEAVNQTRAAGGRIVAVGTTSVRTLESVAGPDGRITAGQGRSALFLYPPYAFRCVDVLLTNFHVPQSTLLMLVSAFAGWDLIRAAYSEAIREKYRFYSYGDCMLII
jgi:S-adenosylmethionine:tRNA ribosyltransferase-isomerase